MTSRRKHKQQAARLGLSDRELRLAELVEEMLESMRWLWVLAYSNQYLVNQKLEIEPAERDRILEAATRAVDRDARLHVWRERLARIKGEAVAQARSIDRAQQHDASAERGAGDAG